MGARHWLRGRRILLVEDEQEHGEVLSELLACEGASVEHVLSGDEASRRLELARHGEPYDLVLLDCILRGSCIQGDDIARHLLATGDPTGVVVVSATHVQGACGRYPVVAKPYSVERLFKEIEAAIERAEARRAELRSRRRSG